MAIEILFAETEATIQACFPAFKILRPHLVESEFGARVRRQQQDGYRLLYLQDAGQIRAAAGFRILEFLAWGKTLYIDDLITLPAERQKGYGGRLLDWLIEHAIANACDQVHLDSGYQRTDAHRLYLNKGLQLACHHFALQLPSAVQKT